MERGRDGGRERGREGEMKEKRSTYTRLLAAEQK